MTDDENTETEHESTEGSFPITEASGGRFLIATVSKWADDDVLFGPCPGNEKPATIKRPLNQQALEELMYAWPSGPALIILHDRLAGLEKQVAYIQGALDDIIKAIGPVDPEKLK